jgi:pimeloyl-ACP methyl ester carboxylesterase
MATFVLVHGSMHGGWCWQRVLPALQAAGHLVYTPTLTGLGERIPLAHADIDLDTHIKDVLAVLVTEDLHDVVLVGHSYGTVVITGVADRMPERLAHLVYLDGTIAADGQAVLDFFPPDARATRQTQVEVEGEGWRLPPPRDLMGLGITTAEDAAWVRPKLTPQPFKTLTQPLRLVGAGWFEGPKTFIACTEAPSAPWRDAMIVRVRGEVGWRYRELATGHDAMTTASGELTALLLETIQVSATTILTTNDRYRLRA